MVVREGRPRAAGGGRGARLHGRTRGVTYVWTLIAIALLGAGLAAAARSWTAAAQREKESELIFVGRQIRDAIGRYYEATPGSVKRYPARLEDLLEDRRFPDVRRHLRRLYRDPMTGTTAWGLVAAPDRTIMGVYSTQRRTTFRESLPRDVTRGDAGYGGWQFIYVPGQAGSAGDPVAAAPAAGAPKPPPGEPANTVAAMIPAAPSLPAAPVNVGPVTPPADKGEKPEPCVEQRFRDQQTCATLVTDSARFQTCWRSSNQRYGACRAGRTVPALRTD